MQTLEVVLPLKIHARQGASDLDRFTTLLLRSFDRFFSCKAVVTFLVLVPDGDLLAVIGRIQQLERSDIRVVCEDNLCPALKGRSGWYKQQILKIAAAKMVSSDYYLVLDADVILKRPTELHDLFPAGKPILQKIKASVHRDWWVASRKILKSKIEIAQDSIVMDVTPEFLHRETCLALQDAIASRNNTEEWDRFLADSWQTGWTEYTLYWLYVLERGLDMQLYDWSPRNMYEGIWKDEHTNRLSPCYLRRIFAADSNSFFLVVQSNINLELSIIQERISPYLADEDGTNSAARRAGVRRNE